MLLILHLNTADIAHSN